MNDEKPPQNIYTKLNAARAAFHQHKLTKTGRNDFAKFNYFELSDFLPHALNSFADHGLCGIISFGTELATMNIVDVETKECVPITTPMSTATLKACHPVQNLGAVETYLRRYLWAAAMELIETDPLDASTGKEEEVSTKAAPTMPSKPSPKKVSAATPRKALEGDEEVWDVLITSITPSKGVGKNGKPFKRWALEFKDGRKISTFSESIGESLQVGEQVRLIVKPDGKFHKLMGIEEAHEELVSKPANLRTIVTNVLNVEEQDKSGKMVYMVHLNDIEIPIAGTRSKSLGADAYNLIAEEGEDREAKVSLKPGRFPNTWELIDIEEVKSLEEEFSEKEAE
jgi:hypothetical protein